MIAADSSVVVAIARREQGHQEYATAMLGTRTILGAPSLLEARMVLSSLPDPLVDEVFLRFRQDRIFEVVDFTPAMALAAHEAFKVYGKGRGHPAQLNFGDCMSYAVAKSRSIPLLFKGNDFALTDIEPALRP